MKSIDQVQEEIIAEFSMLDGNLELTLDYLMELGQRLETLEAEAHNDENLVKGCQSKVWLTATLSDDNVEFKADSNTAITKGLVSLLIRIFTRQTPQAILDAEIFFPSRIGMERFIGTQRSNGFSSMIQQIKRYALAYKARQELNM
jgi:cysteine desulfuration protein SufE